MSVCTVGWYICIHVHLVVYLAIMGSYNICRIQSFALIVKFHYVQRGKNVNKFSNIAIGGYSYISRRLYMHPI